MVGLKDYIEEGTCKNDTNKDMQVCIGEPDKPHRIETLKPGQSTPPGIDCDGIMHEDGGTTKIWGRSGFGTEHDPKWVKDHWPECLKYIIETNSKILGTTAFYMPPGVGCAVRSPNYELTPILPNGWFVGTRGQSAPIDGIQISSLSSEIGIRYYLHSNAGDSAWHEGNSAFFWTNGAFLDSFAIQLTKGSDKYDIVYKVHIQEKGDTGFVANGVVLGVAGKRIEGILLGIVRKAPPPPIPRADPCIIDTEVDINDYRSGSLRKELYTSEFCAVQGTHHVVPLKSSRIPRCVQPQMIEMVEGGREFPLFASDLSSSQEKADGVFFYEPDVTIPEYMQSYSKQIQIYR